MDSFPGKPKSIREVDGANAKELVDQLYNLKIRFKHAPWKPNAIRAAEIATEATEVFEALLRSEGLTLDQLSIAQRQLNDSVAGGLKLPGVVEAFDQAVYKTFETELAAGDDVSRGRFLEALERFEKRGLSVAVGKIIYAKILERYPSSS